MKIERAVEILDPEHREHYDDLEEVNEACRMGMAALKAAQSAAAMIESVLDTLVEVGNGVTDEMLHEAADKLFSVRDLLEIAEQENTEAPTCGKVVMFGVERRRRTLEDD